MERGGVKAATTIEIATEVSAMARWFVLAGVVMLVIGLVLHFAPGLLNWFGRLPGDIRVEKEHARVFIPLTSMLVISIVLTLLINLFNR